ncbi:MAG: SCO family protein [Anaerolineaceae bacterium]|nr:SCO family protein [Anaerolineaceae bacterium]
MKQRLFGLILLLLPALAPFAGTAAAHGNHPDPMAVTFEQNLDGQLPLDVTFIDETETQVALNDYFGAQPVVVVMGYFECPTLCVEVVYPALAKSAQELSGLAPGADFTVLAITIDPAETAAAAARTKTQFLGNVNQPGWHFLTGSQTAIDAVADAIGFHYAYDEATEQFSHPSGIVVLTPAGKIARYFMGVEFSPRDLRLALIEAGEGTVGTAVDQLLLLCYRYDPQNGRYNSIIWTAARLLGMGTLLVLAAVIWRAQKGVRT